MRVVPGGHISARGLFGCRPGDPHPGTEGWCPHGLRMHAGIDIQAPEGTPVHAVQQGRVIKIWHDGQLAGYGNVVQVQHTADSMTSWYAHLARIHVREGQRVWQGQHIADVGRTDSGRSAGEMGSHLHLEIHREAIRAVNPTQPPRIDPLWYMRLNNVRAAETVAQRHQGWSIPVGAYTRFRL